MRHRSGSERRRSHPSCGPGRVVTSTTTRSSSSRCTAESSALDDALSAQCRSSTTTTTGPSSWRWDQASRISMPAAKLSADVDPSWRASSKGRPAASSSAWACASLHPRRKVCHGMADQRRLPHAGVPLHPHHPGIARPHLVECASDGIRVQRSSRRAGLWIQAFRPWPSPDGSGVHRPLPLAISRKRSCGLAWLPTTNRRWSSPADAPQPAVRQSPGRRRRSGRGTGGRGACGRTSL